MTRPVRRRHERRGGAAVDPVTGDGDRPGPEPGARLRGARPRRGGGRQAGRRSRARTGRRPNVVVILMDDVGWGDFGCYGGGRRGGRTDAQRRPARPGGPAAHVVLQRAVVHAHPGVHHDGPPADAPRPPRPAHVRHARRAQRRGHAPAAPLRRRLRDPGRREVAHGREPARASPRTSGSTTSTASCPCRTCTPSGGTPTSSPRSSTARPAPTGCGTCRSTSASSTRPATGRSRRSRRSPSPCSPCSTTSGAPTRSSSSSAWRRSPDPWFLYHCTRGAHFDNYPHPDFLGRSPARHPYKDAIVELDDICGRLVAALERTGQLESTMVVISSDNGPGDGDLARLRLHAVPLRQGIDLGGRRAGAGRRVVARHDRAGSRAATASSTSSTSSPPACPWPGRPSGCRPTATSTRSTSCRSSWPADDREAVSNRKFQHYWLTAHLLGPAGGRVQVHRRLHLRRRHRRPQPRRVHGRGAALRLRPPLQPLPRSRRRRART